MRVLLDTHALLWWLDGDRRLSQRARRLIGNDETTVLVSAASAWEICTKFRLGRLPGAAAVAADVTGCLDGQGFLPLPITVAAAGVEVRTIRDVTPVPHNGCRPPKRRRV